MTFGFRPPEDRPLGHEGTSAALASLLASIALVIAMLLVMTVALGVTRTGHAGEPFQQSTQIGLASAVRG